MFASKFRNYSIHKPQKKKKFKLSKKEMLFRIAFIATASTIII